MNRTAHRPHALIALLAALALGSPANGEEPFSDLGWQDAAALAEKEGKLLLVYFHAETDPDCKRMVSGTWADPTVREWVAAHAQAVRIEQDDLPSRRRFGVNDFPMTLLLRADGSLVHRMEYYHDVTDFLVAANSALLGLKETGRPEGQELENPMAWLAWANWLFANEPDRYDECLDAYLWCLDRGEEFLPGFRSKHFDFLCHRIAYCKNFTMRAHHSMVVRRNHLRGDIVAGTAGENAIWELWRLNFWAREEEINLAVFAELAGRGERQDEARLELMRLALAQIVAHWHYEDVLGLVPDPVAEIKARLAALAGSENVATESRADIVSDAVDYYECLLHAGRGGDAAALLQHVTTAVPTGRAFAAFIGRSNRLEFYKLSLETADTGLATVTTDKAKNLIRASLKTIPAEDLERVQAEREGDGGR